MLPGIREPGPQLSTVSTVNGLNCKVLVNFEKKLGLGQTPAPLLGPNSQLLPKICFESFPYMHVLCALSGYTVCIVRWFSIVGGKVRWVEISKAKDLDSYPVNHYGS